MRFVTAPFFFHLFFSSSTFGSSGSCVSSRGSSTIRFVLFHFYSFISLLLILVLILPHPHLVPLICLLILWSFSPIYPWHVLFYNHTCSSDPLRYVFAPATCSSAPASIYSFNFLHSFFWLFPFSLFHTFHLFSLFHTWFFCRFLLFVSSIVTNMWAFPFHRFFYRFHSFICSFHMFFCPCSSLFGPFQCCSSPSNLSSTPFIPPTLFYLFLYLPCLHLPLPLMTFSLWQVLLPLPLHSNHTLFLAVLFYHFYLFFCPFFCLFPSCTFHMFFYLLWSSTSSSDPFILPPHALIFPFFLLFPLIHLPLPFIHLSLPQVLLSLLLILCSCKGFSCLSLTSSPNSFILFLLSTLCNHSSAAAVNSTSHSATFTYLSAPETCSAALSIDLSVPLTPFIRSSASFTFSFCPFSSSAAIFTSYADSFYFHTNCFPRSSVTLCLEREEEQIKQ